MITLLFLLLLTLTLLFMYFYSNRYAYVNELRLKESLSNRNTYLSKRDTDAFIRNDGDGYIYSLTPIDLHARKVKTHQEYISKCANSALDFDKSSIELLDKATVIADEYLGKLKNTYIDNTMIVSIPWKFALSRCEDDLPHTREDIVFIPPSLLRQNTPSIVSVLVHEKVHIYQRKYINDFQKRLINNGYSIIDERNKYAFARSNPDLDRFVYSDKDGRLMISMYKNETPTSITDIIDSNAHEHPFEQIAYEIGDMVHA